MDTATISTILDTEICQQLVIYYNLGIFPHYTQVEKKLNLLLYHLVSSFPYLIKLCVF